MQAKFGTIELLDTK